MKQVVIWALCVAFVFGLAVPYAAQAKPSVQAAAATCSYPESDAEALVILSNYTPRGYWWDHTDLTAVVQAAPTATPEQLAALHHAIATWSAVLEDCFDGLITLTDITGTTAGARREADIVLHFVPTAGGVVFAGQAICGGSRCPNIMVDSVPPPSWGDPYDPQLIEWIALHELGHALGLGHTTNLFESTDLMGYGWPDLGDPVLSQCDVDALAYIFAWALEGSEPQPPGPGPYVCSTE